tara:strand:- start:1479 stop:1874 length:396 start_codon:yes stop_codon:yes gene_type:complete
MNTQLLCTFTNKQSLDTVIDLIKKSYDICFSKIYSFTNEDDKNEIICTYNVFVSKDLDYNLVPNTISVHRKKQTNTLYTINALNELIKNMNNGVLDKSFEIPWENFQNMLLVTNSEGLNRIKTKINNIYTV